MNEQVIKRNGEMETYDGGKILAAVRKAFAGEGQEVTEGELKGILYRVEESVSRLEKPQVEEIQDIVERVLMESGYYQVAKCYILYRERRAQLRVSRLHLTESLHIPQIESCMAQIQRDFPEKGYDLSRLDAKYESFRKESMTPEDEMNALIKAAVELTGNEEPQWEMIAARLLYHRFRLQLRQEEENRGIRGLYEKIRYLTDEELYGAYILEHYSREDITRYEGYLDEERNKLYTYSGLDLLLSRYVIHDRHHVQLESPQEMYLGIAMHLAMKEEKDRDLWVKKFYDMLSLQKVTMATPTLSNARKPYHQLSSCFIDTVPDSLDGIDPDGKPRYGIGGIQAAEPCAS